LFDLNVGGMRAEILILITENNIKKASKRLYSNGPINSHC